MAEIIVKRSTGFTVMSNYHLRDSSLSLKAKGLLSMMLSLPVNWDYTIRGLAAICAESKHAIGTALTELEKAGYVERHQTVAAGKFAGNQYIIHEMPITSAHQSEEETDAPCPGFSDAENPSPENSLPENPSPKNRPQINKELTKQRKKKEKKSSSDLLADDQLRELLVSKVGELGMDLGWTPAQKNELFLLVTKWYGDRAVKSGKPPIHMKLGVDGLFSTLRKGKTFPVIVEALETALASGWTSVHPKPPQDDPPASSWEEAYPCL